MEQNEEIAYQPSPAKLEFLGYEWAAPPAGKLYAEWRNVKRRCCITLYPTGVIKISRQSKSDSRSTLYFRKFETEQEFDEAHGIANPARATPPATPAPTASGGAGEREPDLTSRNALRYMADRKYAEHPSYRTAFDFIRLPELLHEYALTLQQLKQARTVAEDAFQHAAGLQQQLAEAGHELRLLRDGLTSSLTRVANDPATLEDALTSLDRAVARLASPPPHAAAEAGEGREV